jgi:predicted transcriptional regulator
LVTVSGLLDSSWRRPQPTIQAGALNLVEPMAQSAKKLLRETLDKLPDDATLEEAIERLLFLAEIEQGIADAEAGRMISHEEAKARLGL